jgi:hypothetical protein
LVAIVALATLAVSCRSVEVLAPATTADGGASDSDSDSDIDSETDSSSEGCDVPSEACAVGAEGGETCDAARVVSRAEIAAADGVIQLAATLEGAADDDTQCEGLGADLFFRVFLVEGETVAAMHTPVGFTSHDPVIALFEPLEECGAGCGAMIGCDGAEMTSPEAVLGGIVASASGWYTIKVDAADGTYPSDLTLDIAVGCAADDCGC